MADMSNQELMDLYPEGRTFYDETDDQAAFIKTMNEVFNLVVCVHYAPADADLKPRATVYVPANKLKAFYDYTEEHGITVGT